MSILINIPEKFYNEIHYVMYHWFEKWLDLKPEYIKSNNKNTIISFNGLTLEIENIFFPLKNNFDVIKEKISKAKDYQINEKKVVSFFYKEKSLNLVSQINYLKLNNDIIGDTFFLLSDYQMLLNPVFDKFGRFLYKNSVLKKYIKRPIVNEIFEIFKKIIVEFFKIEVENKFSYQLIMTHDVDHPFKYYRLNHLHFLKNLAGDFLLRKNIPVKRIFERFTKNSYKKDPFNTFDIFIKSEKDIQTRYYFYSGSLNFNNPDYAISKKHIQSIIKRISADNPVGIHLGLDTSNNYELLKKEIKRFSKNTRKTMFSRFHYLAYNSKAAGFLGKSNIKEDSSVAFADQPGFRTGCCYSYNLYDLIENKMTNVEENPLILMEGSLLDKQYSNFTFSEIIEEIDNLGSIVKEYNGNFTVLWHNHRMVENDEIRLYKYLIKKWI